MAQMPEESRKFTIVDSYWRAIMVESVKNTNCLVVTDQPNMLQRLVEANGLLEEIQHGLNAYLEMKRLFFPRSRRLMLSISDKKLSYRRGTARCAVSVEILLIATQQCRNYLYDRS